MFIDNYINVNNVQMKLCKSQEDIFLKIKNDLQIIYNIFFMKVKIEMDDFYYRYNKVMKLYDNCYYMLG